MHMSPEAKTIASSKVPITNGRQPRGSRAASSVSPMIATSEYAPSTPGAPKPACLPVYSASDRAMRCTMTSGIRAFQRR